MAASAVVWTEKNRESVQKGLVLLDELKAVTVELWNVGVDITVVLVALSVLRSEFEGYQRLYKGLEVPK